MAEQLMNVPEMILKHVDIDGAYPKQELRFDPELGFLTNGERLIAFGEMPEHFTLVHPPEAIEDLPRSRRKFIDNAKGVGMRVGNQPTAMIQPIRRAGSARHPFEHPALSVLEVSGLQRTQILDVRSNGMASHIGGYVRHLSLLAQAKVQGDKAAIARAEHRYGNSPAIRMSLPPSWSDEHKLRGIQHTVSPEMLLLRSRKINVRKIGSVSLERLTLRG